MNGGREDRHYELGEDAELATAHDSFMLATAPERHMLRYKRTLVEQRYSWQVTTQSASRILLDG